MMRISQVELQLTIELIRKKINSNLSVNIVCQLFLNFEILNTGLEACLLQKHDHRTYLYGCSR
jgi:hypothetical protein